jgi:hypothetical protein
MPSARCVYCGESLRVAYSFRADDPADVRAHAAAHTFGRTVCRSHGDLLALDVAAPVVSRPSPWWPPFELRGRGVGDARG